MGGGDGTVVVKQNVRVTLTDPTVSGQVSARKRSKMDSILARDDASWSPHEVHFLLRCIGDAYDAMIP